ncbi:hypothetical protein RclHR1_12030002 [Rhizophagus clarus]|uniref:Protein kinase domain-containing protein n=1 Tax=Rhizophagus clarus TaxID=94130 RepID=A0A2Z6QAS0_9GLOM|nr:hypothetical protein RclHR1_12030002 [Rhizophagus clarus]
MLTEQYVPKLANFKYACTTKARTILFDDLVKIVHWLAPEKMFNKDVRYDVKCEIFSFGMLLWELTFEKVPYQELEPMEVENYVKGGKREKITFGHVINERELEIQKLLEKVIKEAWQQNPEDRILLINLFNELGRLQSKYKNVQELSLLPQKTLDLVGSAKSEISDVNILPDCKDLVFDLEIETAISFDEGIKAHNSEKYEEAWKCFKYHSENGNLYAKYWKGYYLMNGIYIKKNIEESARLFKETADKGLPDVQL